MRKIFLILLILLPFSLNATTYYVATTGSDAYPGTLAQPFATWQKGMETAEAGDTVYIRGGIWYPTGIHSSQTIIVISPHAASPVGHDGTEADPICIFNYPDEVPILDCRYVSVPVSYLTGIGLTRTNCWEFKGLTIRNILQDKEATINGISCANCSNITFENMSVHHIGGKGFVYGSDFQSEECPEQEAFAGDTIRFINTDAYNCMDSLGRVVGSTDFGNYSDGFWCSVANPESYMVYTGCRAWNCSDDGYDIPSSGVMLITNNWAFLNGHLVAGVGNGFRNEVYVEESPTAILRYFYNNLSAFNKYTGIGSQTNFQYHYACQFYNNTAYKNKYNFGFGREPELPERENYFRNNIAYAATEYDVFRGDNHPMNYHDHNAWPLATSYQMAGLLPDIDPPVTVTDADFISVDSTNAIAEMTASRKADFSLPTITFMHLAPTSDMIGVGADVGMSDTPNLGVDWEYLEEGVSIDSMATGIYTFVLAEQTGLATIDTVTGTPSVDIEVEYGTDVTDLSPTITLNYGATISPLSGVSVDFTTPQTYTVTALNGITTKEYTVTVTVASEPPAPEVATISSTYTAVTANITGRIISANGGTLTARGICWSTSNTSPTTSDTHTTYTPYIGSFTDVIRGLRGNTTYYFRAYASTEEGGTSYGDCVTITTPSNSKPKINGSVLVQANKIVIVR